MRNNNISRVHGIQSAIHLLQKLVISYGRPPRKSESFVTVVSFGGVVYDPDTYLFLVHCVQGVLGQGLSVGYRKINGAYHSDDAITSDVINKTELSIGVTM